MNIKQLIQNATHDEDYVALDVYHKIIETSEKYNLSITESINKLLVGEKRHFIVNLLNTCKAVLKEPVIITAPISAETNNDVSIFEQKKSNTKRAKSQKQQEKTVDTIENIQKSVE